MIKKFKKLTIESKVFYVFITFIILWFIIVIMSSCASSIYKARKEQIKITHVLAVTEMGDTLKIPIESIKPNVVYNVVGYDYMRYNPYYSPYNNRYYYDYYNYSNYNNNFQYSTQSTWQPPVVISTPSVSSQSNSGSSGTSGFSGNPVASNPVTISGGMKTKN